MDHEINYEGALEFAHQFIASAYYMPGTNPANLARAYIELTGKADALRARVATLEADNARLREVVEEISVAGMKAVCFLNAHFQGGAYANTDGMGI